MSAGPLDPVALLSALSELDVDFVVIGALAVGVHAEVRATADVDVMVPIADEDNRRRLERALTKLDAERIPASEGGVDPVPGDPYPTLMFRTRYGKLDILYRPDGSDTYPAVKSRSVTTTIGGQPVAIAGRDDLVHMKLAAGRPDDFRDVASLTAPDRERPRRVLAAMKLDRDVDPELARDLANERVLLFDPAGRVWMDDDLLRIEATRAGLSPGQIERWAHALAERLHAIGMLADAEINVEIEDQ